MSYTESESDSSEELDPPSPPAAMNQAPAASIAVPSVHHHPCCICSQLDPSTSHLSWNCPRRCGGSDKWVHERCLLRWMDEIEGGDIKCSQCQTAYVVLAPSASPVEHLLRRIGGYLDVFSLCVTGGAGVVWLCVTSVVVLASGVLVVCIVIAAGLGSLLVITTPLFVPSYLVLTTLGALTVVQVLGSDTTDQLFRTFTLRLLVFGLPFLPVLLFGSRLAVSTGYEALVRALFHHFNPDADVPVQWSHSRWLQDYRWFCRACCSSVLFPSAAVFVGKVVCHSSTPRWRRALVGAACVVAAEGLVTVFYKYRHLLRRSRRIVAKPDQ